MHSTLALRNQKEKKGEVTQQTYNHVIIARDTWMPSLENWGCGLKIFSGMYSNDTVNDSNMYSDHTVINSNIQ